MHYHVHQDLEVEQGVFHFLVVILAYSRPLVFNLKIICESWRHLRLDAWLARASAGCTFRQTLDLCAVRSFCLSKLIRIGDAPLPANSIAEG